MHSDVFFDNCRCFHVNVKSVNNHRFEGKDSLYSEIQIKSVPKRCKNKDDINGNDIGML